MACRIALGRTLHLGRYQNLGLQVPNAVASAISSASRSSRSSASARLAASNSTEPAWKKWTGDVTIYLFFTVSTARYCYITNII